ncbi:hypothetical protein FWK35_00039056 [Aphis craccivora]|uniref:Uncharacterized protein n=1 Tax=Aphis craccivora TaxID=307492 RepID=A0A6G0VW61_APHCR|nr:hypothetical protein FWK35_00039056 [Aphis craccivora]
MVELHLSSKKVIPQK